MVRELHGWKKMQCSFAWKCIDAFPCYLYPAFGLREQGKMLSLAAEWRRTWYSNLHYTCNMVSLGSLGTLTLHLHLSPRAVEGHNLVLHILVPARNVGSGLHMRGSDKYGSQGHEGYERDECREGCILAEGSCK